MPEQQSDPLMLMEHLPSALIYTRAARHQSLDDVSAVTGVTKSMLARIEHKHLTNLEAIRAVTRWIAVGDATMWVVH